MTRRQQNPVKTVENPKGVRALNDRLSNGITFQEGKLSEEEIPKVGVRTFGIGVQML